MRRTAAPARQAVTAILLVLNSSDYPAAMTDDQVLQNMRDRVAQCRRLATLLHDPEAVRMLIEMAEQGEADIEKLEGQRDRG